MVRWVGAFYSRVIKPQTFSEPVPLDWELHKVLLSAPCSPRPPPESWEDMAAVG